MDERPMTFIEWLLWPLTSPLKAVKLNQEKMMSKLDEVATDLTASADRLTKAFGEITGKVGELTAEVGTLQAQIDQLTNPPQALLDSAARVGQLAQDLDNIVPDPSTPTEPVAGSEQPA